MIGGDTGDNGSYELKNLDDTLHELYLFSNSLRNVDTKRVFPHFLIHSKKVFFVTLMRSSSV